MLPLQAKPTKSEAGGTCDACGCLVGVGANGGQERLRNDITAAVFMWLKTLGKEQTWRACWVNLGLGNRNSH